MQIKSSKGGGGSLGTLVIEEVKPKIYMKMTEHK